MDEFLKAVGTFLQILHIDRGNTGFRLFTTSSGGRILERIKAIACLSMFFWVMPVALIIAVLGRYFQIRVHPDLGEGN
jgi:hypothetical protein